MQRFSGPRSSKRRSITRAAAVASTPRVVLESIEPRLLFDGIPTAAIQVSDITSPGGTSLVVTVTYTDDNAIAHTSIGRTDVTVVNQAAGAALVLTNVTESS